MQARFTTPGELFFTVALLQSSTFSKTEHRKKDNTPHKCRSLQVYLTEAKTSRCHQENNWCGWTDNELLETQTKLRWNFLKRKASEFTLFQLQESTESELLRKQRKTYDVNIWLWEHLCNQVKICGCTAIIVCVQLNILGAQLQEATL